MLGGLSKTATSALRQLLDAGTLSNLPAGFKAKGLRLKEEDEPLQCWNAEQRLCQPYIKDYIVHKNQNLIY